MFESRSPHDGALRLVCLTLALFSLTGLVARPVNALARPRAATDKPCAAISGMQTAQAPNANGKIAFESDRDGDYEIYVMNQDGSSQTRLTNNPANDRSPAWSPDGARIAFVRGDHDADEIYVMNADGSNQTRVTDNAVDDFSPAWSPDGTKIAFVRFGSSNFFDLFVMNADGSGQGLLAQGGTNNPAWSPDGTMIAFQKFSGDVFVSVFVVSADGSKTTQLTASSAFDYHMQPTWSPDGAKLAFIRLKQPFFSPPVEDVYVMNSDGSNQIVLIPNVNDRNPAWSPDGAKIALDGKGAGDARDVFVVNSNGGGRTNLTNSTANDAEPAWQPLSLAPSPATVQFEKAGYAVGEGSGRVTLYVFRTGDASSAVSVGYASSDSAGLNSCGMTTGAASSRCDYAIASGTLRFAPGEVMKSINIPVVDDSYAEGNESFNISLLNPSAAGLGSNGTASVTLTDNDAQTGANPLDSVAFFARQHYIDFLSREPEPGGYQAWQDILNNCAQGSPACDRIEVSSAFFRSTEFQERGYFVYRLYSAGLGRLPHYAEFFPDAAKVSGFLTPEQLEAAKTEYVNEFAARADFRNKYDSLTDAAAYVDALLQTAGLPNHPGRGAWVSGLKNGTVSRAQVLRGVAESAESYNKFYIEAFVVMQYFGYLRRDPDILYLEWIDTMSRNGGDYRVMINGFVNSSEYRQRFGP